MAHRPRTRRSLSVGAPLGERGQRMMASRRVANDGSSLLATGARSSNAAPRGRKVVRAMNPIAQAPEVRGSLRTTALAHHPPHG